jgi:competence protein ComEC
VSLLPPMPVWGLILVAMGGTWLCLWHGRWRLWGLAAISCGALTTYAVDPPDVLVDGRGKLLAVKTDDGRLTMSSLRAAPFSRGVWLRRIGQDEKTLPWPRYGPSPDGRLNCDLLGCIYHSNGAVVALISRPEALLEDCQIADVIVSTVPVGGGCPAPHTIVDRFDLWRNGTHALWLKDGRARVESVNGTRGARPWVLPPAS